MIKLKCPESKCVYGKFICCYQCENKPCKNECNMSENECIYLNEYRINTDNYRRSAK